MDPYQPQQQPDEGYSEDPLSGPSSSGFATKGQEGDTEAEAAVLRSRYSGELSPLLTRHISSLSLASKIQLTESLLESLPTSIIAQIVQKLNPRLYIDFIRYLPAEICLNILAYLDPLSLISVARSCRAWYGLALDRKLWERLYYLEGWKTIPSEIQAWEEKINRDRPVPSEGGSHASKRRAISSSRRADDVDNVMVDVDPSWRARPAESALQPQASLFGNSSKGSTSSARSYTVPLGPVDDPVGASSKKKEKEQTLSPSLSTTPAFAAPDISSPLAVEKLPKSTLWGWDAASGKYRMNWKHLYALRRRLELNWELGKFTNFQLPHPDHPKEAHGECIYTIQFNSEYLVSGSRDRTIRIWNMHTRRLVRKPLVGHRGSVLCLQFDSDPEEDLIVSGSSDSNVILWRFSTGEILQRLHRAHREPVLNVKFDKNILVTCSKDKTIKIFNRRQLKPGDLGYGAAVPFQPVPIHLKNYGYDGLDQLPIKPPYTLIGSLEGHGAAVNAVQIYGREVVSASGDRNVKIWDWPNQTCVRTLIGHHKGIACVQYDGRRIVSGSSDNEVKVFDRRSGLEVASLRSHSNLVRTVQAGFGDLPYSEIEDEKEAARLDQRYLEAKQNGTLSANHHQRRHASDVPDDDSLRPENIRFTGAKLPPGGGGGKYGRIVSGSYDTTIIIWRRDKRGLWKAQHHLKQEEAAAAAAATTISTPAAPSVPPSAPSQPLTHAALHALQQTAHTGSTASPGPSAAMSQAQPSSSAATTVPPASIAMLIDVPDVGDAAGSPLPPPLLELVDELISQGVHALQQALATYPALLTMQGTLQAAIDRHPSPFVRSQLRQAVSTALVRSQISRARAMLTSPAGPSGTPSVIVGAAGAASSSNVAQAASSAEAGPSGLGSSSAVTPSLSVTPSITPEPAMHSPFAGGVPQTPATPAIVVPGFVSTSQASATEIASSAQSNTVQPPTATAAAAAEVQPAHPPTVTVTGAPPPPAQAPTVPVTGGGAVEAAAGPPPHHHHHPHIHGEAANPARVFKLQFDARRIICCSQTSVIVGWDFCNGDAELEEAVRFFGTVE